MKNKKKETKLNDNIIDLIDNIENNNEKEELIEKEELNNKKSNKRKISPSKVFSVILLSISVVCFIVYITIEIINYENILNNLPTIISSTFILLFILCFTVVSIKNKNKKSTPFIILGSFILISFSIFNILCHFNLINLPSNHTIINFYNKTITYGQNFCNENNLQINEVYEYSDIIPEYHIISQDIPVGTLVKDVNEITLIISRGPDYQKEVIVPSFIGWKFEDVIKYIENNFLNNVNINFIESNNTPNTVINQVGSGTMKRNDLIKLDFSIDDVSDTKIIDFTNKSLLYSTSWLKMHGFKYEIEYVYNDNILKDYVVNQSIKNEVANPSEDLIKLTVSKGKMIVLPDLLEMSQDELNKWIMDNNLKVNYNEVYSEDIPSGDIIESNYEEGDVIEVGSFISVTISKGKLEMIKLTSLTDFYLWAEENDISYSVEYEYHNTIKKDDIIKCSHQTGDLIKKDDTVIIYVSKGKSVTIPNFIGMNKTNIESKCRELNLSCSFTYGGFTENTKKDIALKQSKSNNTIVSEGTNLVITLSSGVYEKVTIPNYVGKSKTEISNSCKKIGLTCNFAYQSTYSNTAKDTAVKQSKTGTVNKGTSITITLSKGPAKTYTIVIDPNQLTAGNATATKNTLKSKLESACPGVTFTFTLQKSNSAIGYLAENSEVKVGKNTFTQGKTYKVIINSN